MITTVPASVRELRPIVWVDHSEFAARIGKLSACEAPIDNRIPASLIRIAPGDLRDFDTTFTMLSLRAHVAFIFEGAPLHPTLDATASSALWKALLDAQRNGTLPGQSSSAVGAKREESISLPFEQALKAIADAFDYEAVPEWLGKDGIPIPQASNGTVPTVYVLKKRYTDPRDIPFVTYDELLYSLVNIDKALNPLNPHAPTFGPDYPLQRFAASLTSDQVHDTSQDSPVPGVPLDKLPLKTQQQVLNSHGMAYGTGYLPVSSLAPEQQRALHEWAEMEYIQTRMDPTEQTIAILRWVRTEPRAIYRRMNLMGTGIEVFGFEGPFGLQHWPEQYCLSHGSVIQLPNGTAGLMSRSGRPIFYANAITAIPARGNRDPNSGPRDEAVTAQFRDAVLAAQASGELTDPLKPTPVELTAPVVICKSTITLGGAVKHKTSDSASNAVVDPILAAKTVSVFGVEMLTPSQYLQALADTYGLRVLEEKDGSVHLTLRTARPVRDNPDVPEAVRQLFPEPLLRYQTGVLDAENVRLQAAARAGDPSITSKLLPHSPPELRASEIHQQAILRGNQAIYDAIVHRLRVLVEPQVDRAPDGRLPIGQTGDEALRLFALLYVTGQFSHSPVEFLTAPPPHVLGAFQSASVTCSLFPKGNSIGIQLVTPKPGGGWQYELMKGFGGSGLTVSDLPALVGQQPATKGPQQGSP